MHTTVQDVCQKCPTCQTHKTSVEEVWLTNAQGSRSDSLENITCRLYTTSPQCKTLHIDTIGEYSIDVTAKGKTKTLKLRCLTMKDPATGWFEIAQLHRGRTDYVANLPEQIVQ